MTLLDIPNGFWDENFINLIEGMRNMLGQGDFVIIAEKVAAILSLIYLSVKAYAMILGEGRLEFMPLLRPFVITLVIVNFGLYAKIVGGVGKAAENIEKTNFEAQAKHMDAVQFTKDSLYDQLWVRVLDSVGQVRQAVAGQMDASTDAMIDAGVDAAGGGTLSQIGGWMSKKWAHANNSIQSYITLAEQMLFAKISMWIQNLIEFIVLSIFKGVAYCIWFIQMFLMYVLLSLGPLSFAASILKPFRDSWIYWTQKYFAVSFYVAVAMIVLNMGLLIVSYGIEQEISRMTQILQINNAEAFASAVLHADNFLGYLITALLVVIAGIIQIPTVCSWILGQGGEAIAGVHGAAVRTVKKTVSTAGKAAGAAVGI